MAAQFMRCLDCDSPSAALQLPWRSVIEQISGQLHSTNQVKLCQFLLHAGKARPPRIATECQERHGRAALDLFSYGRIAAFTLGPQQLVKTFADCRRQPPKDISVKSLLMRTQRRARNALYTVGRWRFDRQLTTARFQPRAHCFNLAAGIGCHVIPEPFG